MGLDTNKNLSDARKQMVEQRRLVIKSLALGSDREQLDAHLNLMMKIQKAIDVIDRVVRDERASRNQSPVASE
jgi:hypothetical protein